jgi:hypothetical protein
MNGEIEVVLGSLLMIRLLQTQICFERVRMVFYTVWSATVWYSVYEALMGREMFLMWFIPRQIASINTVYCYELMFHRPDAGHTAHHIATILLQSLAFYSGFSLASVENSILCSSAQLGLFSSIFSSARTIAKTEDWTHKRIIANIYYHSYLLAKPGFIVAHYLYWYMNRDIVLVRGYEYVHVMYGLVHLIQCYFSWKIVKVLWHQWRKRE